MITLALLKLLEENEFGQIGRSLFWQKMPLGKTGLFITNLAVSGRRGERKSQRFEIFSIGDDDVDGLKKIEAVAEFLRNSYAINNLPAVEDISREFENVAIMPPSTVSSLGQNEQGRVVYSISGEIYY